MEETVEQITSQPEGQEPQGAEPPPRKKDPNKVAAGKALARKNKEPREAKLKLDAQQQRGNEAKGEENPLFDTIRNVSILVGCALVLYHGYQAFNAAFPKGIIRPSGYVKGEEVSDPPAVRQEPKVRVENSIQMG